MPKKTLEELQTIQSEMLATASDLGMSVPEDLTLDFQTTEVGEATCNSLDAAIRKFREGIDAENKEASPTAKKKASSKKKKSSAKADSAKADSAKAESTGQSVQPTTEEKTMKTAKKKKASAKSPTAKESVAKKAAAKKASPAKAAQRNTARGLNPDAKIQLVVKPMPDIRKGTKWYDRLKRIYDSAGKKVSDFKGSKADLSSAVQKGLIKIS